MNALLRRSARGRSAFSGRLMLLTITTGHEPATDLGYLHRKKSRGLAHKRSLALREFALGVGGLERFIRRECTNVCPGCWRSKVSRWIRGSDSGPPHFGTCCFHAESPGRGGLAQAITGWESRVPMRCKRS